jgi:hypothetical protein
MFVQYDDYGTSFKWKRFLFTMMNMVEIIQAGEIRNTLYKQTFSKFGGLYIHYNSYGYCAYYGLW